MTKTKYKPEKCKHCGQTTTYALMLDRGTALIVLAIYNAVRRLDRNRVHLTKDMEVQAKDFKDYRTMVEGGWMTSNMADNVLRAKYHGLVAQVEGGGRGEYLITPKGAQFLRGREIPRVAIVDKRSHSKLAYLDPEGDKTTFGALMRKETPFWDFADIDRWFPEAPAGQLPLIHLSPELPTDHALASGARNGSVWL